MGNLNENNNQYLDEEFECDMKEYFNDIKIKEDEYWDKFWSDLEEEKEQDDTIVQEREKVS